MSKTAKPESGKAFESAVAKIERALVRDPTVTEILAPARLPACATAPLANVENTTYW